LAQFITPRADEEAGFPRFPPGLFYPGYVIVCALPAEGPGLLGKGITGMAVYYEVIINRHNHLLCLVKSFSVSLYESEKLISPFAKGGFKGDFITPCHYSIAAAIRTPAFPVLDSLNI